jgi:N-acetylmuramoyl-L-alanine amidase CwlA
MNKILEDFLSINPYSRTGDLLKQVLGIVIHWTANPNAGAKANRNFFENRKFGRDGSFGAAQYIIDFDGTVIRCIPDNELAYHVGSSQPYKKGSSQIYTPEAWLRLNTNSNKKIKPYPNNCTIGIECCVLDLEGKMTSATYIALVELCSQLLKKYSLTSNDLWLHKEIVGWKDCHRWFVNNPNEWTLFKGRVKDQMAVKVSKPEVVVASPKKTPDKGVIKVEQWKIDIGKKALDALDDFKVEGNPLVDTAYWSDKLDQPVPAWMFLELMRRVIKMEEGK